MKSNNIIKYYFSLFALLSVLAQPIIMRAQENRPRIGLVLSGGGARGIAHIGTLKLIDSLQIPIDYIVGTSMGGIIGALYASGYTGNEIEKNMLAIDWDEMLNDSPPREQTPYLEKKDDGKFQLELGIDDFTPVIPSGFISGQMISLLFSDLTSGVGTIRNFDNLPIPFRCVAIDLLTGSVVTLKEGTLSKAMRATMSIPSAFSPVEWGDSLLVDGGILNNFPADVLKEMGADIIIGVNVGSQLAPRSELKTLVDILSQTMVLTDFPKQKENFKLCDVIIQPELDGFTTTDFDKKSVNEILKRGITAASENKGKLIKFKDKYVYDPFQSTVDGVTISKEPIVSSIVLSGKSSYPLEYVYELIGHAPNDTLDLIKLHDKVSEMKTSGMFSEVEYSIQLLGDYRVNIYVSLKEKIPPVIYGFTIVGNENLHFDFILDLLEMHPGEPFDKVKLKEQIKYMVSLGYFEEVTYIIEHVRDNYLRVKINIKEKPFRKLRVGFRYNDKYKFIGMLGLQATNIPIIGIREELLVQFAGLFKIEYFTFYPSRTLNLPIFPYIKATYKDIPMDFYDGASSEKIAEYNDRSFTFGAGFGHILKNTGTVMVEYQQESMNISPTTTTTLFPTWKDNLRVIHADLAIDRLDDPTIPHDGFIVNAFYDFSMKSLGSEIEYRYYTINAKYYKTFAKNHTVSLSGFYTDALYDLPIYKWTFNGGSNSFVGMKIDQIVGYNYGYVRFDYRYEFNKNIFFKFMINSCEFNTAEMQSEENINKTLLGYGLGVKLLTIVGPFEIIFSHGSKSIAKNNEFQNVVYFTAGFLF